MNNIEFIYLGILAMEYVDMLILVFCFSFLEKVLQINPTNHISLKSSRRAILNS